VAQACLGNFANDATFAPAAHSQHFRAGCWCPSYVFLRREIRPILGGRPSTPNRCHRHRRLPLADGLYEATKFAASRLVNSTSADAVTQAF
jgi:hypothetical protein